MVGSCSGMLKTTAPTPTCPNAKFCAVGGFWTRNDPDAVPEHGVGARPPDVDVLPEPGGERRLDIVEEAARRPSLVRLARGKRARRLAVQKDVPAGCRLTRHERVAPLVGVATLHERELAAQRERKAPRPHPARNRFARHAVLHREPFRSARRAHHAVDEVKGRGIAHPAVLHVVEGNEVGVVGLVGVVLLGDVVRPVHVAVFARAHGRVEFRHAAQVLDADVLDTAGILVFQDFAAAPAFLDRAGNRRVDRDRIPLHVRDDTIPVDVERLPAALRRISVHPDGGDPVAVADAPDDHRISRLEPAG